jgi:YD repeat-containing protein
MCIESNDNIFILVGVLVFLILLSSFASATTESIIYTYDNAGVLRTSVLGSGETVQYSYDNSGNRLSQTILFTDVSSQVSVTDGLIVYSRATGLYNAQITVTNISSNIPGKVEVALSNLPLGITLLNYVGTYNGAPYITASTNGLASGASITIAVQFKNPGNVKINFTPVIYEE